MGEKKWKGEGEGNRDYMQRACSETALNRSCSKKTYCVADREKRHIVKIIYVNGTQVFLCDAMFECDIMSGTLCLK